jgi:hypothetical protein
MTLIEQILPVLSLLGGLTALVGLVFGAGVKMRGRQAVDETHAGKLSTLESAGTKHASKCDADHGEARTAIAELDRRVLQLEGEKPHLERRLTALEKKK